MLNLKKAHNLKIVSLLIFIVFCLNTSVYSLDIHAKSHLRPNLLSDSKKGIEDMLTSMLEVSEENWLRWVFLKAWSEKTSEERRQRYDQLAESFGEPLMYVNIDMDTFILQKAKQLIDIINFQPGDTMLEIESGLTGIGLIAALKGVKVVILESDGYLADALRTMSERWRSSIEIAGGEFKVIEGTLPLKYVVDQLREINSDGFDVISYRDRNLAIHEPTSVDNMIDLKNPSKGVFYISTDYPFFSRKNHTFRQLLDTTIRQYGIRVTEYIEAPAPGSMGFPKGAILRLSPDNKIVPLYDNKSGGGAAEMLYEEWQKKYDKKADILLSIFGQRMLENIERGKFIERVLDIAVEKNLINTDRKFTRFIRYFSNIIAPAIWKDIFNIQSSIEDYSPSKPFPFNDISDEFLYLFIKNKIPWEDLHSTYYLIEKYKKDVASRNKEPDYNQFFKMLKLEVKAETQTVEESEIILDITSSGEIYSEIPDNNISRSLEVMIDRRTLWYDVYISTDDKEFLRELGTIAKVNKPSQLVFYFSVTEIKDDEGVNRSLGLEFQPIVRLQNKHPEKLKTFMARVERFAYWLLQNCSQNLAFSDESYERINLLTTEQKVIHREIYPPSTGLQWYTYSPQKAGFRIISWKGNTPLYILNPKEISIDINFLWELPVNISSQAHLNQKPETSLTDLVDSLEASNDSL